MSVRRDTDVPLFDTDYRLEYGAQLDLFTGAVAPRPGPPRLLPDAWQESSLDARATGD